MFAEFEKIIKSKIASSNKNIGEDVSKIPQKHQIAGKQIQQVKLLSEGAFGFIWLAEDLQTRQQFALKRMICMSTDRLELAQKELQLMMKLPKHPNLVTCFGGQTKTGNSSNKSNTTVITLMEFCPGGSLFDLLEKREHKGFTEAELVTFIRSIATGLHAIHSAGYYHQDIKVENVLLGGDQTLKICDFGSCSNKEIDFASILKADYAIVKQQMESVTTAMYRPPEMVDPYLKYKVSSKVDIWMLGCVLYTLSYFIHPFVNSSAVGISSGSYRFLSHPKETEYHVTEKIKDLIRHMLTPNPTYRPSAKDIIDITSNWNHLGKVPLNIEAIRRKEEERQREKELQVLNRSVVSHEGDIPIEQLMKIKAKLTQNGEENVSSFVKPKNSQQPQNNFSQNSYSKFSQFQSKSTRPTTVTPKLNSKPSFEAVTVNADTFWGKPMMKEGAREKSVSFDAFGDIFGGQSQKKEKPDVNMFQLFDFEPKPATKPPSKSAEINLLDL